MEHKPLSEVRSIADLKHAPPTQLMTRRERLDRWAELLEIDPGACLTTLDEIEHKRSRERRLLRADNSALTVAFSDPVLRAEGLLSDRFGDAVDFFELTDQEAHLVLCSCHCGATMSAGGVARRVRGIRSPALWSLFFGWFR